MGMSALCRSNRFWTGRRTSDSLHGSKRAWCRTDDDDPHRGPRTRLDIGVFGFTHIDGDASKGFSSLLYGGSFAQLGAQAIGAFSVMIYSFVLAWVIGTVIQKTMGFRIKNEDELAGVDTVVHGEEGYALETV